MYGFIFQHFTQLLSTLLSFILKRSQYHFKIFLKDYIPIYKWSVFKNIFYQDFLHLHQFEFSNIFGYFSIVANVILVLISI